MKAQETTVPLMSGSLYDIFFGTSYLRPVVGDKTRK